MKVLILNGSPRANGNTHLAISEIVKIFDSENVGSEVISVGKMGVSGCKACHYCYKNNKCVIDDEVNTTNEKLKECDGLIIASPVYYASANGSLVSFCDRLFYSNSEDLTMKVGAALAVARRGGITTTFDQLNKYFTISGMPIASGQYWNGLHGAKTGEGIQDHEGMQQMRTLARNMVFLMKSIKLGKDKFGLPHKESFACTNFVR